jgi:hypothetical protein
MNSALDIDKAPNTQVLSDVALPQLAMQIDYNLESKSDEEKISHTAHSLAKNLIFHNQLCVKPPEK